MPTPGLGDHAEPDQVPLNAGAVTEVNAATVMLPLTVMFPEVITPDVPVVVKLPLVVNAPALSVVLTPTVSAPVVMIPPTVKVPATPDGFKDVAPLASFRSPVTVVVPRSIVVALLTVTLPLKVTVL